MRYPDETVAPVVGHLSVSPHEPLAVALASRGGLESASARVRDESSSDSRPIVAAPSSPFARRGGCLPLVLRGRLPLAVLAGGDAKFDRRDCGVLVTRRGQVLAVDVEPLEFVIGDTAHGERGPLLTDRGRPTVKEGPPGKGADDPVDV